MNAFEWRERIFESVANAMWEKSKLDQATLAVEGFCTPVMRHLYNNLCAPDAFTYLEVGLWFGASFTAACCYNMGLTAFGVESFAQPFHRTDVREKLMRNLEEVRVKTAKLTFIEQDCWTMDKGLITRPVDLFLYDGEHSEESQFKALPHFLDCMADTFLFAVDDWNWPSVSKGTLAGLASLQGRVRVTNQWTWNTEQDDPKFHNGLALFLIQRL